MGTAKAAASEGVAMGLSSLSNHSLEDVAAAGGPDDDDDDGDDDDDDDDDD
jgi:hypothetical protein